MSLREHLEHLQERVVDLQKLYEEAEEGRKAEQAARLASDAHIRDLLVQVRALQEEIKRGASTVAQCSECKKVRMVSDHPCKFCGSVRHTKLELVL